MLLTFGEADGESGRSSSDVLLEDTSESSLDSSDVDDSSDVFGEIGESGGFALLDKITEDCTWAACIPPCVTADSLTSVTGLSRSFKQMNMPR